MSFRNEKRIRRGAAALLALAIAAAALAAGTGDAAAQVKSYDKIKYPKPAPFTIPQPERWVMPNGMVVLLMEDPELPLITMNVRVKTGSRLEPADKAGLASLTGTVLRTGGAGARSGDEIDDFLDGRGARIETGIGVDQGTASLSCLKGDFPEVVKILADILRAPKFDESKLKIAKNQSRAGIARRNDNPMGIMFREGDRLIYGSDSAYARMEEYATIDAVTQADMKAFHAKYFVPNRVLIGVVGDFKAADMKKTLEGIFGDWAKGADTADAMPGYQKKPKAGVYFVEKTDMTQSDILMGHLGILRNSPDFFAASVMNEVLSGSFASRLFNNIRTEKGLAYSVRGQLGANFDYPGTFTMWMTTKTETTGAAIEALLKEVDDLTAKPATEEEVERAKQSIRNSFIFNYDSKGKILNQQLTYAYFDYPPDFLAKWLENVEKVKPEDVTRVAKAYVKKEDLAILVVGKKDGLDKPLETFGTVSALDITIPEPAAPAAAPAAAGIGAAEAASKGKEVLGRLVEAMGGAAKVDGVKSLRMVSQTTAQTQRGEMTLKVTTLYAFPDRMRQEMSTPMGAMSTVVTPTEAFANTPMGLQPLPDSRKADMLKGMKRLPILILQHRGAAGFSVAWEGADTLQDAKVDRIAVTLDGETTRYAVDQGSGLIVAATYRGSGPGGVPGEIQTAYADWRDVAGVKVPYKTKQTFNGEAMASSDVEEAALNEAIADDQFAKPAAAPAGGGGI